jgi:hypothetical protein
MARQHRSNNRAAVGAVDSFWSCERTDETDGPQRGAKEDRLHLRRLNIVHLHVDDSENFVVSSREGFSGQ